MGELIVAALTLMGVGQGGMTAAPNTSTTTQSPATSSPTTDAGATSDGRQYPPGS
jgi:hypothetical protein